MYLHLMDIGNYKVVIYNSPLTSGIRVIVAIEHGFASDSVPALDVAECTDWVRLISLVFDWACFLIDNFDKYKNTAAQTYRLTGWIAPDVYKTTSEYPCGWEIDT